MRSIRELSQKEKKDLIDIGMKKKKGLLNCSWSEIADMFDLADGEKVRGFVNKYRQTIGDLRDYSQYKNEKVLIISDLHIPHHDENTILELIKENPVDTIIIAGDILDGLSVSSWGNFETQPDLHIELIEAHKLFLKIREITNSKIIMIQGNHDNRWRKLVMKKNLQCISSMILDAQRALVEGFYLGEGEERKYYIPIPNMEYIPKCSMKYGEDVMIVHPAIFRKNSLATIQTLYSERIRWTNPEIKAIFGGHTHKLAIGIYQDVLIGETGCCCVLPEYAKDDSKPMGLTSKGGIRFNLVNGEIDINSVNLIYKGIPV